MKRDITRLFESRKGHLDDRIIDTGFCMRISKNGAA